MVFITSQCIGVMYFSTITLCYVFSSHAFVLLAHFLNNNYTTFQCMTCVFVNKKTDQFNSTLINSIQFHKKISKHMASDQFNCDQFNSNFQFDTKYEGHIPIKTSLIDVE